MTKPETPRTHAEVTATLLVACREAIRLLGSREITDTEEVTEEMALESQALCHLISAVKATERFLAPRRPTP